MKTRSLKVDSIQRRVVLSKVLMGIGIIDSTIWILLCKLLGIILTISMIRSACNFEEVT
jgi:hypothetical protein